VLDGLLHQVLEHRQIDVVKLLDVEAALASLVLAQLRQKLRKALDSSRDVER